MIRHLLIFGSLLMVSTARADLILSTNDHADVEIGFHDGQLGVEIHFEDRTDPLTGDALHVDPSQVLFFVGPSGRFSATSQLAALLNVNTGDTLWRLPQIDIPTLPFLGIAPAEDEDENPYPDPPVFDGPVRIFVTDVRGPGNFALIQTGPFQVFVNSTDGLNASDMLNLPEDHSHYNWIFTAPGVYQVDLRVEGTLLDGGNVIDTTATLNFGVEAIPEPSSALLLGLGGLGFLASRRLRSRAKSHRIA